MSEETEKNIKKSSIEQYTAEIYEKKDRAQITSSSALSVGLIVILKNIIETGPKEKNYYILNLALVCLALALQIIIGLLTIMMQQNKKHVTRTSDRLTQHGWESITGYSADRPSASEPEESHYNGGDHDAEQASSLATCCPCCVRRKTALEEVMGEVNTLHEDLVTEAGKNIMKLQKAREKLITTDPKDTAAVEAAEEDVRMKKAILTLNMSELEKLYYADQLVAKQSYLKRVDLVQTIITYLLYCTFVLNAFLVGFNTSRP